MLCIFDGRPSLDVDAGVVQLAIISQVTVPENSNLYQERSDGHFDLTRNIDGDVVSETPAPGPQVVRFSTTLAGININDFPARHSFGNGVTIAATVSLGGFLPRVMSWCVFPDNQVGTVNANFAALQALMET